MKKRKKNCSCHLCEDDSHCAKQIKIKFDKFRLYWQRGKLKRFLVNVLIPFVLSLVPGLVFEYLGSSGTFIIHEKDCTGGECLCNQIFQYTISEADQIKTEKIINIILLISVIYVIFQFVAWVRECQEINLRWKNAAAKCAYNDLFEVHRNKNTQFRTAYHRGLKHGMLSFADVPYDVFSQIRKICWEFCNTIGDITKIDKKDLSATFIYRYTYKGKNSKDTEWRWITGKGSKNNIHLDTYVRTQTNVFSYLLKHKDISTYFSNDKKKEDFYKMSYRDISHGCVGSFFAAKVAFSSNKESCCEGIILIRSYGKRFMDDVKEITENEMEHFISDEIFPCYRHLLQTELAMLYFCHQTEPMNSADRETLDKKELEDIIKRNRFRCLETDTQKKWYNYKENNEDNLDEK